MVKFRCLLLPHLFRVIIPNNISDGYQRTCKYNRCQSSSSIEWTPTKLIKYRQPRILLNQIQKKFFMKNMLRIFIFGFFFFAAQYHKIGTLSTFYFNFFRKSRLRKIESPKLQVFERSSIRKTDNGTEIEISPFQGKHLIRKIESIQKFEFFFNIHK